ncbi:MAG: c-type cytochrome [Verrucomicrobiae bacterium]|nr:c-type cytochrome [Verrucomicrobiae bacterium]
MNNTVQDEDPIRPHSFDGIEEYDKKLPNWWLFTLYITILFAIGYWFYYHKSGKGSDQFEQYQANLATLEASVAANAKSAPEVNNDLLFKMSKDPNAVSSGQQHFLTNCATCHGTELQGPPAPGLPGVSLVDNEWIHGFEPMQLRNTITNGVLEKGMPSWGPVLGDQRILELVSFIVSKQPSNFPANAVIVESSSPAAAATAAPTTTAPASTPGPVPALIPPPPGLTNEQLIEMSKNPEIVEAGHTRFSTLCVACHGTELQGPPAPGLPGVSLVDAEWLHGNEPLQIRNTIMNGVIEKGMVSWAPIVGDQGANELVAFILSRQPK